VTWKFRLEPVALVTLIYGFSGLGFALANVLFARRLAPLDYGTLSLALALIQMSVPLAPLGIDGTINRHQIPPSSYSLERAVGSSLAVAFVVSIASVLIYGMRYSLSALIFLAIAAGGANVVVAAHYQSLQLFKHSLLISQCSSLILLGTAPLLIWQRPTANWMCLYLFFGYLLSAIFGWKYLRRASERYERPSEDFWSDSLAIAGNRGAGLILSQLERLIIPRLLGIEQLAQFGVLATLMGSPYHILHLGIGQTLLPRLRSCNSVQERRRLIRNEATMVFVFGLAMAPLLWQLAPLALKVLLNNRYSLSSDLIVFALATGFLKVSSAFVTSSATALAGQKALHWLAAWSWFSIGGAVLASSYFARFGLVGIIACVGFAWLLRVFAAIALVIPHLRIVHDP